MINNRQTFLSSDEQYLRFLRNQFIPILVLLVANQLWMYFEKQGIGTQGWTFQAPASDFSPLNLLRVSAYLLGGFFASKTMAHSMLGPAYAAIFLFFLDHAMIFLCFLYCINRQIPGQIKWIMDTWICSMTQSPPSNPKTSN